MKRMITLALALLLLAPALAGPAFDDDKLIAAVKVLMYQAPCCGDCARLNPEQAREILSYLHGEDSRTGQYLWLKLGEKILAELEKIDPAEADRVREQARKVRNG